MKSNYRVKSLYDKWDKKPYVRQIIDRYTNEVIYYLRFDHYPDWDEIVNEVNRLDAIEEHEYETNR